MFSTSVSGEKMKNKKVVVVGVLLSEALSPLSELGESGGEFEKHLRAQCIINSLCETFVSFCAKRKNGTKQAFEDRKPFLRLKLEKSSIEEGG